VPGASSSSCDGLKTLDSGCSALRGAVLDLAREVGWLDSDIRQTTQIVCRDRHSSPQARFNGSMLQRTIRDWLTARRLRRRFRSTPEVALEALPEDTLGRVRGTVHPLDAPPLVAPYSGRPCVSWVVELVQHVVASGEDESRSDVARREDGMPFILEHGGSRAIVDPKDAVVSLAFDHVADAEQLARENHDQNETIARYLRSRSARVHVSEIREAVIAVGETITILGAGTREPDPSIRDEGTYRDGGNTRLRLTSSKKHPLYITDNPKIL
jgi:hypothetical protein